ncbi:hypothetical protein ACF09H_21920 [Streptomyces sp. NPDC014983]|uniref:hypothetical protein n=1 Tax=Streptomyces sp. NPDC014983 TaxID=3364933 RepID=UPI0036FAC58B
MTPEQVQQMCCDILGKGPDVADVSPWSVRPGVELTFSTGARLWLAITTADAAAVSAPSGLQAPPLLLPRLIGRDRLISLVDAELYLASVLHAAGDPRIRSAYAYGARSTRPRSPGIGLLLADGGRAYLPVAHTARAGQSPGRRPFGQLQDSF